MGLVRSFLMVGPLRGGGGLHEPQRRKTLFYHMDMDEKKWEKNKNL